MERARRLADGRPRPPKVYSSYSFQGPLQLPSVSRRREGREEREKGAGNDTREEGRGGNVEKGKERGKSKTEKGETETRRGRLGKGPNEARMTYEMRKGSSNIERRRAGSQGKESNGKESFGKGKTRNMERGGGVGEKEPKEAEKEVVQELQENGTEDGSVNREEKEAMKRETRRKSPAVTSISEDAKPWGRRQNSPASSPLVPSSSLQSLPNPSRGGLSLAGSFTLPRRTNKSGSEPPVIRPFLSHHLTPSSTSKRALSSTLSAPQPRTSAFCPSCPPRTYASLPRTFNSLPRRSNKASYTFYSHSISTTISASPTASSTNLFIPRKVPASLSRLSSPSPRPLQQTSHRPLLQNSYRPLLRAEKSTMTPPHRAFSCPPGSPPLTRKVSLRALRSPRFQGWECPILLARLLAKSKPSTSQAL